MGGGTTAPNDERPLDGTGGSGNVTAPQDGLGVGLAESYDAAAPQGADQAIGGSGGQGLQNPQQQGPQGQQGLGAQGNQGAGVQAGGAPGAGPLDGQEKGQQGGGGQ
jgi:hypothetical protein